MSTWTIIESKTDKEVGTIKNQLRLFGSKMEANGSFGSYVITGNFGNRSFTIKKAGEKVRWSLLFFLMNFHFSYFILMLRSLTSKRRVFIFMIRMVWLSTVMLIKLWWFYLLLLSMKFVNIKIESFFKKKIK